MADIRGPDTKELAKQDYLNGMKYKELAEKYLVSLNTIKSWVKRYDWSKEKKQEGAPKNKKGAPLNNKNAVGHGAPKGNLNSIKHGAYQSLYTNFLSDEEKAIYNQMTASINFDEEIRLLRLKIARLLNRERTFFYDILGKKHVKEISEEDREGGILACVDQLRRLIESKAKTLTDTEQFELDKEKFEFQKYKTEIELQLKKEKFELEKTKVLGEDEETEDDGFLEALKGEVSEVWDDAE